jgi:hypothetical protein
MMNIPQNVVAVLTSASHHEEVSEEMVDEVAGLLEGASRLELLVLIAGLGNISNYAMDLLEANTHLSKAGFLDELGQHFAGEES